MGRALAEAGEHGLSLGRYVRHLVLLAHERLLITRETPPDNRRVVRARLSDRGREILARADQAFLTVLDQSFSSHLPATDRAPLRRILKPCSRETAPGNPRAATPARGPGKTAHPADG